MFVKSASPLFTTLNILILLNNSYPNTLVEYRQQRFYIRGDVGGGRVVGCRSCSGSLKIFKSKNLDKGSGVLSL